jgi:hypothetical protein
MSCNNNEPVAHSLTKTEKNLSAAEIKKGDNTNKQKLSSILYDLAVSQDPESFAKTHHIFLDKSRVRVFIFFEPTSSEPDRKKILEYHGIIIEKKSVDTIRGLVAVDHLIPLSKEPVIRSIRLPDKLIKTRKTNP